MNLKKSDKIIAIVGVLILIIAAVGIILYAPSSSNEGKGEKQESQKYYVKWTSHSGELATITGEAYTEYNDQFVVGVAENAVITSVNVQINWQDDNTYGGFFGLIKALVKGQDTLIADIGPVNGKNQTYEGTGEGNETLYFIINDVPQDKVIDLSGSQIGVSQSPESSIKKEYQGENSVAFDVSVTVKTGEKFQILKPIRSLINKMKDKGNDFELTITYDYYTFEVTKMPSGSDGNGNTGETGYNEMGAQTYSTMAYPGKN